MNEPEKPPSGFRPLPSAEQEICLRFGHARRGKNVTQAEVAALLKVSRNQIANIEARRVPLKFWLGERFCAQLGISQSWLATGALPQFQYTHLDERVYDPRPREEALYSDVYERLVAGEVLKQQERLADVLKLRAAPPPWLRSQLLEYWAGVEALAREKQKELNLAAPGENSLLTSVAVSGKLAPVKSQLKNLLADLNHLTKEPGTKTKLADFLGAPLTSISRWLSGEREPGGETTLRLLHWVEQQERQPNTLDSASNTAKGKTQVRKSPNEKQTQVHKK